MAPAQAIIAALSVQSSGGGTTRRKICLRAMALERGLQALIGGDAAGDHQHALRPLAGVPLVQREAARRPVGDDVGDRLLEARAEIGDVLLAQRRAR